MLPREASCPKIEPVSAAIEPHADAMEMRSAVRLASPFCVALNRPRGTAKERERKGALSSLSVSYIRRMTRQQACNWMQMRKLALMILLRTLSVIDCPH